MGAVQSWCCGDKTRDDELLMPPGKRATQPRSASAHGAVSRSFPKAIQVQGPAYSSGSFESKYEIVSEIGHGSTSIVYRCRDRRRETLHACKIIDRRAIQSKRIDVMEQFQVEIQVLQSMHHPNIIRIDDVYLTDNKICLVTEYMDGGELFDYIVEKGTLSEIEASAIVRKITSAIAYMHNCGVIHRDLKPENLMLTSKSAGAEVKIIDFGLAKLLDEDAKTQSFLGTRGYLAPEMLQRQAYTRAVDMWALGVIVYVLLCGCLPFNDDGGRIANDKAARAKFGLRFPRWASGLSEGAKDLLRHLLEVDDSRRYTAEQALAHPWVTGQRTPNQYLRSPNYLRTIKEKRMHVQGEPEPSSCNGADAASRIASRRQSH
ncbi:hypothetical protein P43SY_003846 [Pythium insidiosum]|uniref:Protein kinase domain-containing protein n=1 Tax=Pythium insidiosum TaxID=114742 RepID=A0AAD5Q721_PYTIN|nr:hypothetical protein P43SY_003846 [Pythium insidiosum]